MKDGAQVTQAATLNVQPIGSELRINKDGSNDSG